MHKQTNRQTDKPTDTTKIMVTWPLTNQCQIYKCRTLFDTMWVADFRQVEPLCVTQLTNTELTEVFRIKQLSSVPKIMQIGLGTLKI